MAPLTLLWLEPTPLGSAARTHLDGTLRRLQSLGLERPAVISAEHGGISKTQKLVRLARLVRRARQTRPKGVLLTRWHPFSFFVTQHWQRRGGHVVLLLQGNDATVHETYPWFKRVPFSGWMIAKSLRTPRVVLALNEGLADWVNSVRGPHSTPATILPTGVDDVFHATTPRPHARPYVLFFGNLARWQGVEFLLAAKASPSWPAEVELWIAGRGEMGELVRASESPTLRVFDRLPPEELAPIVAGALATICPKLDTPSMAETTTPFKMLESAAAGVPVIASDIPAQRRIVEADGYGLLVSLNDPSQLSEAVANLHMDSDLRARLADAARRTADRLSWENDAAILGEAIRSTVRP